MRILKKTVLMTMASTLMVASFIPAAMAMDAGVNTGKNFTDVTVGMGQESEGLYINGNWIKNNKNGREKTVRKRALI